MTLSADLDRLAWLARLSEDALRTAALDAEPNAADALTDRAGERASQVEQLRALDRPAGTTAEALHPSPHAPQSLDDAEAMLKDACRALLADPALPDDARRVVASIEATCR